MKTVPRLQPNPTKLLKLKSQAIVSIFEGKKVFKNAFYICPVGLQSLIFKMSKHWRNYFYSRKKTSCGTVVWISGKNQSIFKHVQTCQKWLST